MRPGTALWAVSISSLSVSFAAGAPAPMLPLLQAAYGMSPSALSSALGAYLVSASLTTLVLGRLSNFVGRRPIALAGLAITMASSLLLVHCRDELTLVFSRGVQGIGLGLSMSALAAWAMDSVAPDRTWPADLVSSVSPAAGVALGSIVVGFAMREASVSMADALYGVTVLLAVCAALLIVSPDAVRRRPGALRSLRPRTSMPPGQNASLIGACLCFMACWSLGGFYQALAPAAVRQVLAGRGPLVSGAVTSSLVMLTGAGGLVTASLGRRFAVCAGPAALIVGLATVGAGFDVTSLPLVLAGSGVAGVGFGATISGSVSFVAASVAPDLRAGLIATLYFVGFLGAGIITWLCGVLVDSVGYTEVVDLLALEVVALASIGSILVLRPMPTVHPWTGSGQ